jgi:hypothetical protein
MPRGGWRRCEWLHRKGTKWPARNAETNTLLDIPGNTVRPSPRHIFEDKLLKRARSGVITNPCARRSTWCISKVELYLSFLFTEVQIHQKPAQSTTPRFLPLRLAATQILAISIDHFCAQRAFVLLPNVRIQTVFNR